MQWILPAESVGSQDRHRVGGKGFALAQLAQSRFDIPRTWCITTAAYDTFLDRNGLRERILLELNRKNFAQMRWEEIWDCASRIRHMFLNRPLPADLKAELTRVLEPVSRRFPLALRSSAPGEDAGAHSFAGLHDSFVNINGIDAVLEHIRRVWASLWKDTALLYRQEIGLDVENSAMAVVVQEVVVGNCSGIAFTRSPDADAQGMVEAVYGLNPGLVDGFIEPDRWRLDRNTGGVVSHTPTQRSHRVAPFEKGGIRLQPLPQEIGRKAPLSDEQVKTVFQIALDLETEFKAPQDVEWTLNGNGLVVLQSRPITAAAGAPLEDNRSWYLSLHRSFENLQQLRRKIEDRLIPDMVKTADTLQALDLVQYGDDALADEIERRQAINQHWVDVYWADFIPYAHGVRLFGQIYNDRLHPEDPYEFVRLLANSDMISTARNRMLLDMAAMVRQDPRIGESLRQGRQSDLPDRFKTRMDEFTQRFGDLTCNVAGASHCGEERAVLVNVILQLSRSTPRTEPASRRVDVGELEQRFINAFDADEQPRAQALLELARSSYRLRDDDNIHLGRIEAQLIAAVQEGRRRLVSDEGRNSSADTAPNRLHDVVARLDSVSGATQEHRRAEGPRSLKARQLVGQPAGPGIARGHARIVRSATDAVDFEDKEILVCDAIDPNLTFIVPLAAGIVERRGGMLIHGAIIAREYGLPCVTGVPEAAKRIRTGDVITVDGYLGIVTVE